ncbi:hypothetical protein ANN_25381 [Periplaneta americana]|uniref:PDZ domain-containing protein n=1 Tax=Periplaneta americana TaxID=6978 RepID=A0ABQ8S1E3_PERAM|nr:hypothetical protein ANN_25381 [Periplaneta americana]
MAGLCEGGNEPPGSLKVKLNIVALVILTTLKKMYLKLRATDKLLQILQRLETLDSWRGAAGGGVKVTRKASETRLAGPGEEVASPIWPCVWLRSGCTRGGRKPRYSDKLQNKKKQQQSYPEDYGTIGGSSRKPQKTSSGGEGSAPPKKAQASSIQHAAPKYDFPVKRLLLTRDPKDRSVGGNGLGMRVIGGKEIPGTGGQLGAFVTRIYPGGVVESLGEIKEGDQVLEWNGTPLMGKTFEEVQKLVSQTEGEVEIVVKRSSAPPKPPRRSIQSLDHHNNNQLDHNGNNSNTSSYNMQAPNCVDGSERKMSECEKRTCSSVELEEPDAGSHQSPHPPPNKVRNSSLAVPLIIVYRNKAETNSKERSEPATAEDVAEVLDMIKKCGDVIKKCK